MSIAMVRPNRGLVLSGCFLLASGCLVALEGQEPGESVFIRGDSDGTSVVELTDAIVTLDKLFLGRDQVSCADAADSNDDGVVDVSDPTFLLNFLFLGGAVLPAPYPEPGADPTVDALSCGDCGSAPARFAGVPCGPDDFPCRVLEDFLLQEDSSFRNGSPALAIDAAGRPHVIFPSGTEGYYGLRDAGGSWQVGPMRDNEGAPVRLFWADVGIDPGSQRPYALVDAGRGTELWQRDPAGFWFVIDVLDEARIGNRLALSVSTGGCLYAGVQVETGDALVGPGIGRRTDAWDVQPVGESVWAEEVSLVLSPAGEPRVAYWEASDAGGWLLRLGSAAGVATVVPLGSNSLEEQKNINFVISEVATPEGRREEARFLVSRWEEGGVLSEGQVTEPHWALEYVHPAAEGGWESVRVADDDPFYQSANFCFEAPPFDGAICPVDFTAHHSLGFFASASAENRFLFSRVHTGGQLVARCPPDGGFNCEIDSELELDGDLRIGWMEQGQVQVRPLLDGIFTTQGRAVLGQDGTLHFVGYDRIAGTSRVRYVRVGTP